MPSNSSENRWRAAARFTAGKWTAPRGRRFARQATPSISCIAPGHSIGQEVHGNGANMDGLETRDDRKIVPRTCFSIEPGIYLPEFGIRSEVNVYVGEREARVTGAIQQEILPLLA